MSVLNIKKSSARFLNPINGQAGPINDPSGIMSGNPALKPLPHTNIDKYPKPVEGPGNGIGYMPPPRSGIREAKN